MKLASYFILIVLLSWVLTGSCKSGNGRGKAVITDVPPEIKRTIPADTVSIHQAALDGDLSKISMMLDNRMNPDTLDKDGRTPLMYAAFNGHSEIMKLLILKGATIDTRDNYGRTALMMASSGPFQSSVKLLLDHSADPNIADQEKHYTALMYAASEGQLECVRVLLAYKADPTLKDADGDDAVAFALRNGHNEVAALVKSFKDKYQDR